MTALQLYRLYRTANNPRIALRLTIKTLVRDRYGRKPR